MTKNFAVTKASHSGETLLYIPAPIGTALTVIDRDTWSRLKSWIRRRGEIEAAVRTGVVRFTDYHHRFRRNTNRGDIAIGQAIRAQLLVHLPSESINEVGWDDGDAESLLRHAQRSDLFVIGGGGYIFLDPAGRLNSRQNDLQVFERFQGKLVAHGIGLNRLTHAAPVQDFKNLPSDTKAWIRRFADRCDSISVRDEETARLFAEVADRRVVTVGDPALSLRSTACPSLRQRSGRVGINTASHGRFALTCLKGAFSSLEQVFHRLQGDGLSLLYFVHEDSDYGVIEVLRRRGLEFEVIDGPVEALMTAYQDCDFVINQMLHSAILAHAAGTSALAVAYDLKQNAYFELFQLRRYCVPWAEATSERLWALATELRGESLEQIEDRNLRVNELIRAQTDFIANSLSV